VCCGKGEGGCGRRDRYKRAVEEASLLVDLDDFRDAELSRNYSATPPAAGRIALLGTDKDTSKEQAWTSRPNQ
jgi:hypothetical protein